MLILNFSHPLTEIQKKEIEELSGQTIETIYDVPVHFENDQSYKEQLLNLVKTLPVDGHTLQTEVLIINLPSYNVIAAELLAWLHGQMGYFPAILRIKPLSDQVPHTYRTAEIINLQSLRDQARKYR